MRTNRARKGPFVVSPEDGQLVKFLHEASLSDDAAELRQLVKLCRRSLRVRVWLFARFAGEPATQAAFRKLLSDPVSPDPASKIWSPILMRQVLSKPPSQTPGEGPYGGLSEARILTLIKRYQGDGMDPLTFLLVRLWTRFAAPGRTDVPATLTDAIIAHWAALASDTSGRLTRDLLCAVRFFSERSGRTIGEADYGHANSWKLHVLVHILEHPQERYQVGELHANLPVKYRHVDRRAIRQFCKEHDIRRDQKPGERPGSGRGLGRSGDHPGGRSPSHP